MAKVRVASHAGSWYTSDPQELDGQLTTWLNAAQKSEGEAKAVITPHAGYTYSGPTAAWAFKQIESSRVQTVFLLGPAHHEYVSGCALPWADKYQTPLGDISIDHEIVAALDATGHYKRLSMKGERNEHSLEMQLPYIRKVMGGANFTLVPLVVGELSRPQQETYTRDLLPFFDRDGVVFVISSDFCHWGENFDFTFYDRSKGAIWQSIEALDRTGMTVIESHDAGAFRRYLAETGNTICGQNPIIVLLSVGGS